MRASTENELRLIAQGQKNRAQVGLKSFLVDERSASITVIPVSVYKVKPKFHS